GVIVSPPGFVSSPLPCSAKEMTTYIRVKTRIPQRSNSGSFKLSLLVSLGTFPSLP
ncbi:hypothetical protein STEG23_029251, partial [Scotinomys teguina]